MDNLSPWVSLLGGIASLISPCTLPLIPVYFASLAGQPVLQGTVSKRKWSIFFYSLSFVLGFSFVFILLGSGMGFIGSTLRAHFLLVRYISGGLIVLFGITMLASLKITWLNYEKHLMFSKYSGSGYLRSAFIGFLFALAWTPCAGPVLGAILTLAFKSGSGLQGAYFLAFYSLGLALPLLFIGLALDSLSGWLPLLKRYSIHVHIFAGLLLVVMGILIILNRLNWYSF
jgi:cytochrome c-type biogenesis protein